MSDDPNFLARWSRRKQNAKRDESDATPAIGPAELPEAGDGGAVDISGSATPGNEVAPLAELSAEELALLPRIEDLTVNTDITQFLRAGVPAVLRNAALRRMWAVDPAIRDFVGEALDYAYDWNVPGGVPGSGPMLASDDIPGMLRQIMGGGKAPDPQSADTPAANFPQAGAAQVAVTESPQDPDLEGPGNADEALLAKESSETALPSPLPTPDETTNRHPIVPVASGHEAKTPMAPRRHGGAVPT